MRDFQKKREALGLTVETTARILGVTRRNVQRWETFVPHDMRDPNPTAMKVMDWMIKGFRPPEWYE